MRNNFFNLLFLGLSLGIYVSCSVVKETQPSLSEPVTPPIPVTPVKSIEKPTAVVDPIVKRAKKTHKLGVIGEIEPVYFLPMKKPFLARIDTGAENSSLDAHNIRVFEREGEKWVSFDLVNQRTEEKSHFEKKIYRQTTIKRQLEAEDRIVVLMTIRMGKEKITAQFSLADRSKFDYQALIGRNILKGRAIVDPALSKTLY